MRKFLFLCLGFSFSFSLIGQSCEKWQAALVNAPSGLIIREKPGVGVMTTVPLNDTLWFCSDSTFGALEYEGIKGYWRLVKYGAIRGYSFDGFLIPVGDPSLDSLREASQAIARQSDSLLGNTPEPNLSIWEKSSLSFFTETYNYCGDIALFDPQLYWYGFYPDSELDPDGFLSVKPVDLKIVMSKDRVSNQMEFDLLTEDDERSLFLLGSNHALPYQDWNITDHNKLLAMRGRRVFPGQELNLAPQADLKLSATGRILEAGDCPKTEDYQLVLRQRDLNVDLKEFLPNYGKCSMPELYWYGQINDDEIPEIIFVVQFEDRLEFTLLISDQKQNNLYRALPSFTVKNCTP